MSQPEWRLIYATDYSALYEDTTGVYAPELMIAQEIYDASGSQRFEVFRFSLDRCALARDDDRDPTGRQYLVPASIAARRDGLPHAIPRYEEWFAEDLERVASSVGATGADLIAALCSEDAPTRACAYEAIGGYHGYVNLDQYPETWSESNMSAWPDKGPDVAPTEDEDEDEDEDEIDAGEVQS